MAEYGSSALLTVVLPGQPATRMPEFPGRGNPSLTVIFAQQPDFRETSIDRFGLRSVLFWLFGHGASHLHLDRPSLGDVLRKLGHESRRLQDDVDTVAVPREHRIS